MEFEPASQASPAASARRSRLARFLPAAVLAAVSLALYHGALYSGFIHDDNVQIVNDAWIRDIRNLRYLFDREAWEFFLGQAGYFRPMKYVIYTVGYYIFGLRPWGFHLISVLFHAANAVLVYLIASRLVDGSRWGGGVFHIPAFAAAVLFAVHPLNTEAVMWIAAVSEVSYTFFFLAALYFHMLYRSGRARLGHVSLVMFAVALLCKEPAMTLPAIMLAYDYCFGTDRLRPSYLAKRYLPVLAVLAGFLLLRYYELGVLSPTEQYTGLTGLPLAGEAVYLFGAYLARLLLPAGLGVFHMTEFPVPSLHAPETYLYSAASIAFTGLAAYFLRRNRPVFFGMALVALPLLPALNVHWLTINFFTERYAYLPSVGFAVIAAIVLAGAPGLRLLSRRAFAAVAVLVLCLNAAVAVKRIPVWRDGVSYWNDAIRGAPGSPTAHYMLGCALLREKGLYDDAVAQFDRALGLSSSYELLHEAAYVAIGAAYLKAGLVHEAIEQEQRALEIWPNSRMARKQLVKAYFADGQLDKAVATLLEVAGADASFADIRVAHDDYDEDRALLFSIVRKYGVTAAASPSVGAFSNLGILYDIAGEPERAAEQYRKALALDPGSGDGYYNLGMSYLKMRLFDTAAECFEKVVSLNPDDADAHNNLGIAYRELGHIAEARAQFEASVRLAPQNMLYSDNLRKLGN